MDCVLFVLMLTDIEDHSVEQESQARDQKTCY